MKLISVIIPVHNAEKTLERAVESVLGQTYSTLELILINDGSGDGSQKICEEYAASDVRVRAYSMEDRGVSAARNKGLELASGCRISFLDADDAMEPLMLETLSKILDESKAAIAGCAFSTVTPEQTDSKALSASTSEKQGTECNKEAEISLLKGRQILTEGIFRKDTHVWGKLFEKERLPELTFQEGLSIGEDVLFLLSLAGENTEYARTTAPLYKYTINPGGAMNRPFTLSYMDQIGCWEAAEEQILRQCPEVMDDPGAVAKLRSIQILSVLLVAGKIAVLGKQGKTAYKKEYEYCRQKLGHYMQNKESLVLLSAKDRYKAELMLKAPEVFRIVMELIK